MTARPLLVGLTGGIASGKSTVSGLFAALGVPVIDADEIAREVVRPGEAGLEAIRRRFGEAVLQRDGSLDRAALRHRVFQDPEDRRALEAILHPEIRRRMFERAHRCGEPYCLLAIPLLVEGPSRTRVDRIVVVDVPEPVQRQRLALRDGASPEEIDRILASQTTRAARLAVADHVIDNTNDRAALRARVAELHRALLEEAAAAADTKAAGISSRSGRGSR